MQFGQHCHSVTRAKVRLTFFWLIFSHSDRGIASWNPAGLPVSYSDRKYSRNTFPFFFSDSEPGNNLSFVTEPGKFSLSPDHFVRRTTNVHTGWPWPWPWPFEQILLLWNKPTFYKIHEFVDISVFENWSLYRHYTTWYICVKNP